MGELQGSRDTAQRRERATASRVHCRTGMRSIVLLLGLGLLVVGCGSSGSSPDMAVCSLPQFCNDTSQCPQGQICIDADNGSHGCYTPGMSGCNQFTIACSNFETKCAPGAPGTPELWRGHALATGKDCVIEIVSCAHACVQDLADGGGGAIGAHCE